MKSFARVLLLDNGSLEPASTRQLRTLAAALEARLGGKVEPVSLAHSSHVAAAELDGRPAELFEAALERSGREGAGEVVVAPLFVGPSRALTQLVPELIAKQEKIFPQLRVHVATPLQTAGETRLGEMIADEVRGLIAGGARPRVAIVDHGSPAREVGAVRDAVAAQVREILGDAVTEVVACSMERRPGAEYDFNEPLLETLLARPACQRGPLVVALLFVSPGRHAGAGGDVERICARVRGGLADVTFTRVLGQQPRLLDVLTERVRALRPTSSRRAGP